MCKGGSRTIIPWAITPRKITPGKLPPDDDSLQDNYPPPPWIIRIQQQKTILLIERWLRSHTIPCMNPHSLNH